LKSLTRREVHEIAKFEAEKAINRWNKEFSKEIEKYL
jgi:hypothetical protein